MTFYTQGQFIEFCKTTFGPYRLTKGGTNIEVVCPICKILKQKKSNRIYTKRKFAIHTEGHMVHCWVCGYKSKNLIHILKKYKPEHLQLYLDKFIDAKELDNYRNSQNKKNKNNKRQFEGKLVLPKDFCLLSTADRSDPYIKAALNYLKGRRSASNEDLWYWRMGVSKADREAYRRIIVPSLDGHGNLNYFTARSFSERLKPKYYNPFVLRENVIFNEINIDWTKELILVEGVFDLFKCTENATMLLGSELPSHFALFQKIVENETPVVLALDPDAKKKTEYIAKRLIKFGVKVKILNLLPNQEDVGSLTKKEFKDLLPTAKVFNTETYLRSKIESIV